VYRYEKKKATVTIVRSVFLQKKLYMAFSIKKTTELVHVQQPPEMYVPRQPVTTLWNFVAECTKGLHASSDVETPLTHRTVELQDTFSDLPDNVFFQIVSLLPESDQEQLPKITPSCLRMRALVLIDKIVELRVHKRLQSVFPFFFPPLPSGSVFSYKKALEIKNDLPKTVGRICSCTAFRDILWRDPKGEHFLHQQPTHQWFFNIAFNPERLADLLEVAYAFSVVQPM